MVSEPDPSWCIMLGALFAMFQSSLMWAWTCGVVLNSHIDRTKFLGNVFMMRGKSIPLSQFLRGRTDTCSKPSTKARRERLRREKLNDSFLDLSSMLEPGRAPRTDKVAILTDAIRALNQLREEAEEYKVENKRLKKEIDSLKAEKNELREEKLTLKSEKDMMEQKLKAMAAPSSGLMPPYSAAYHTGPTKMALYPSYGMFPMWHYLPPSARDTSHDHELRPPAA